MTPRRYELWIHATVTVRNLSEHKNVIWWNVMKRTRAWERSDSHHKTLWKSAGKLGSVRSFSSASTRSEPSECGGITQEQNKCRSSKHNVRRTAYVQKQSDRTARGLSLPHKHQAKELITGPLKAFQRHQLNVYDFAGSFHSVHWQPVQTLDILA